MSGMDTMARLALITLIAMTKLTSHFSCETLRFDDLSRVTPPKELRRQDVEVIDMRISAVLCLKDDCRDLPFEKIRCKLEDHVYTVDEYKRLTKLPYVRNIFDTYQQLIELPFLLNTSDVIRRKTVNNPCSMGIPTDGDYCCPTTKYCYNVSLDMQLNSINNEICKVINLPGKYQFVTKVACW